MVNKNYIEGKFPSHSHCGADQSPKRHGARLVRRLARVRVEGRKGQLVDRIVVHRDEDLARLHGVRHERAGVLCFLLRGFDLWLANTKRHDGRCGRRETLLTHAQPVP